MKTINPATRTLIQKYEPMPFGEVSRIIEKADNEQPKWASLTYEQRAVFLQEMAEILQSGKQELGKLMADEMGKPLAQGISEIEKCAWVCEYYAEHAARFLKDEEVETEATKSYVTYNPLGIVLAIMPWNFPFWQLFRFAAPALMAGNAVILKHSENVTGCALAIEGVIHASGINPALFRTILVPSKEMKPVIQHPKIAAVTLTGSTRAGKIVASQAGERVKKTVLELGGSDPYIILKDADIESAAAICATSRLINSGQSCIAAKRFIVEEKVYDEFLDAFIRQMSMKKMGNPLDEDVDVGPQARLDLRDELHQQVQKSVELGAQLMLGGQIPQGDGAFYPPTVLSNVTAGMPAYEEELFGPVAAVIKAKNEDEAIHIANDSVYGLGAAIFSADVARAEEIAATRLQAGCCVVNDFVRSDPRLPFGGIKESGYGRELGAFGIREFVNTKTVYIK